MGPAGPNCNSHYRVIKAPLLVSEKTFDLNSQMWLNVAMISVKVGTFRNHLSKYLRKVRQGAEIVITDRDTPIGKVVPFRSEEKDEKLVMVEPKAGYEGFATFVPPPNVCSVDAVALLIEDRRRR